MVRINPTTNRIPPIVVRMEIPATSPMIRRIAPRTIMTPPWSLQWDAHRDIFQNTAIRPNLAARSPRAHGVTLGIPVIRRTPHVTDRHPAQHHGPTQRVHVPTCTAVDLPTARSIILPLTPASCSPSENGDFEMHQSPTHGVTSRNDYT